MSSLGSAEADIVNNQCDPGLENGHLRGKGAGKGAETQTGSCGKYGALD